MKKRIITLLLALTCCVPLFAGCNIFGNSPDESTNDAENTDTPDATTGSNETTTTDETTVPGTTEPTIITGTIPTWQVPTPVKGEDGLYRIIINDFERPADISPLMAGQVNTAGEVEKKIVYSGKQSLKIRWLPELNVDSYDESNLRQPLNLEHRKNYSDFSSVKKVTFWAYNAQPKAMDLTISVAYTGETPAFYYTQKIPARKWTQVTLDLENSTVWYWKTENNTQVKVEANVKTLLKSKPVERLTFSFELYYDEIDTVFYIDDIYLHSTKAM